MARQGKQSRQPGRRFIVTGAAGHLGSTIMRRLSEAGEEAYGLLLPGEQAKVLHPQLRYFYGDVCDKQSLRPLFEEGGQRELVVIHTAALISIARKMPAKLYQVNVEGTKNVVALCQAYGVKRLVHVSSVHAIPEQPNRRVMGEVSVFSPDWVTGGYAKTKAMAAQAVLGAVAEGLDAVIVFPTGIIGPYDKGGNHLIQTVSEYLHGKLRVCVKGGYDFVDVRDVADGCLRAAEQGHRGTCYILGGHYASIQQLLTLVGRRCGRRTAPALPLWVAKAAVPLIGAWTHLSHQRPVYTSYSLLALSSNSNFSSQKARQELGYQPRPLADTVADMVDWLRGELQKIG